MNEKIGSIIFEEELTTINVKGVFNVAQLIEILEEFYQGEFTNNLLLDLSVADLSKLKKPDLEKIALFAKEHANLRSGGKTAIFASRPVDFGISRMYETWAKIKGHPIQHRVFYSKEEAWEWLKC